MPRGPRSRIVETRIRAGTGRSAPWDGPSDFCYGTASLCYALIADVARITIDNRGLHPPEPMVRILGALAELGDDDELLAIMDREPMLLYPELERRGWTWQFVRKDGGHELTIRRPGK
ncbi:MAG: hypothetical protein Kow0010_20600 [Dehalococcoidia bacterium]